VILALSIALTAMMATMCFELCVLLIRVVGRLWPSKPSIPKDKGKFRKEFLPLPAFLAQSSAEIIWF
jgi:hypothetical protein